VRWIVFKCGTMYQQSSGFATRNLTADSQRLLLADQSQEHSIYCMRDAQENLERCNPPYPTCQAKAIAFLLELQQHRLQV